MIEDLLVEEERNNETRRVTLSGVEKRLLPPPLYRNKTTEKRTFCTAAPEIWNSLPAALRNSDSLSAFKTGLKTYLFREAFRNELT